VKPGDMEQIEEDQVELAIAKSMLSIISICAAFLVGFACAWLIWGV
jgi:succinate dehydrogenase hydrophobic anchor subunit